MDPYMPDWYTAVTAWNMRRGCTEKELGFGIRVFSLSSTQKLIKIGTVVQDM